MQKFPNQTMRLLLGFILLLTVHGCQPSANAGRSGTTPAAAGSTGSTSGGNLPPGTGTASKVAIEDLKITTLFTKDAAENTCASFTIRSYDAANTAVADVRVTMTLQHASMTEPGKLTPDTGLTDSTGSLSATYCSGDSEGQVTVIVTAGTVQANSSKINVSKKPLYNFTYVRSDTDPSLTPSDGAKDASVIYLNTLDSGPQDCTNLYFKLTKSSAPVVGESIKFSTQPDFPKGAKLAKREVTGTTEAIAVTSKKIAVFTSISSGAGEFAVPICSGVSLGTLLVSGTYTDDEGRNFVAKSPVIRITAGLSNFFNLSLTFDAVNGRTLKGYYNTNSDFELKAQVQLGARQDGQPITDYPAFIATEVGRVEISNGGTPDKDRGTVDFKVQALHLVDNYSYPVISFRAIP